jgi:hypothetical protein
MSRNPKPRFESWSPHLRREHAGIAQWQRQVLAHQGLDYRYKFSIAPEAKSSPRPKPTTYACAIQADRSCGQNTNLRSSYNRITRGYQTQGSWLNGKVGLCNSVHNCSNTITQPRWIGNFHWGTFLDICQKLNDISVSRKR